MNTGQHGEDHVRQRVREAAGRLSGAHRKIAQHVLRYPAQAAFLNVEELARAAGVSSATVVRFAQGLGYDGFHALRRALQQEFRIMVEPAEKVEETIARIEKVSDTFRAVVEMEITYLQRALQTVSPAHFEEAVQVLKSARRVGVLGPGSSEGLVDVFRFRLRRFGVEVVPMAHVGGKDLYEDLHWLRSGDALLVFAFLEPREEIFISLRYAREMGVASVAITDLESSPLTALADVTLVAQRGPVGAFHSLVVPNAVVNALILAYAKSTTPASLDSLKSFQAIRKKFSGR